jgi:hypothetical protein
MLSIGTTGTIYVAVEPQDGRKGIDGLTSCSTARPVWAERRRTHPAGVPLEDEYLGPRPCVPHSRRAVLTPSPLIGGGGAGGSA